MPSEGPIQGVLDFETGNADGFANYQREQEALRAQVRRLWGLPVGRRVRLRLRNMDDCLEGELHLIAPPAKLDGQEPLSLQLRGIEFSSDEVASCCRID